MADIKTVKLGGTTYNIVDTTALHSTSTANASIGQGYGTCSTAANTAAKAVTLSSYNLITGGIVNIWFTTANTTDAPTLNINSKGAKNIFVDNAVVSSTNPLKWDANTMLTFMYDGTQYRFLHSSRKGVVVSSSQPTTTDTMIWISP